MEKREYLSWTMIQDVVDGVMDEFVDKEQLDGAIIDFWMEKKNFTSASTEKFQDLAKGRSPM